MPNVILKKTVDFLLFSSLFITACAVIMSYQTFLLFHLPVNTTLLYFIGCGTVCSYNFHSLLIPKKPSLAYKTTWHQKNRRLHLFLFLIGGASALYFSYSLLKIWPWLLLIIGITFLYSAPKIPFSPFQHLKKIAVAKTAFLTLAWTYITSMLPLLVVRTTWTPQEHLYIFNRFYFIYAICILFDYRDREEDKKEGIRSLITYITDKGVHVLFWITMFIVWLSCLAFFIFLPSTEALTFLTAFVLLAALYRSSKTNTSDYRYYLILDGLMMLPGLLLILIRF